MIRFDDKGLVPVVVQDELTGLVRMVAYANALAVEMTRKTGRATFFSRSRGELWEKGATSGNAIAVSRVLVDCDEDCLVYLATARGPSCHTGETSCFFRDLDGAEAAADPLIGRLEATLRARKGASAQKSYTRSLYEQGPAAIGEKIREEAGELAEAIVSETNERVASEAADVLFHLLVGLGAREVPFRDVLAVLASRLGTSGLAEKAARTKKSDEAP